MKRYLYFLFSIFYFLFSNPAFALDKSLSIEAESLFYDKEKGILEATGEVRVNFEEVEIFAPHLRLDTRANQVQADQGFILNQDRYTLSGESLHFGLKSKTGEAQSVVVNLKGIIVKGEKFRVSKDEIELSEASFTTCDLDATHYRISAQKIYMYPESGWVIAQLGFLWAGPVPVLPVPAFIYVIESIAGRRYQYPLPLPSIGETGVNGFHVTEKVSYVINPLSYGVLGIDYFSIAGLGFSAEHTFVSGDQNEDNLKLSYVPKYGWSAGFIHDFYLGPEAKRSEKYSWRARLDLKSRQLINYETVSFLPRVVLTSPDYTFLMDQLGAKLSLAASRIHEEGSALLTEAASAGSRFDYTISLPRAFAVIPELVTENNWYGSGAVWHKVSLGLNFRKYWFSEKLAAEIGYAHYALNYGSTPFIFEKYRFFADDRIKAKLTAEIFAAGFGADAVYNLGRHDFDELDYWALYRFHCIDAKIEYRSQRREFSFGLSIPSL